MSAAVKQGDPLGQPLTLPCGTVLRNRFLKSAMSETLARPDRLPNQAHVRLYERFAAGGAGVVVTGNVMIDPTALGEPGNVVLEAGSDLEPFRRWARAGSTGGTALWMQLNHPGKQAPRSLTPHPVAPSAIPLGAALRPAFASPRALSDAEIRAIVARFATSARLAREAGFGGVQIHGAHGYLVSQFLSPHHNRRDDDWGGDAPRRRRFVREVYGAIRAAVGADFPVSIKLNSADFQRGGFSEDESLDVVRMLAADGIDLIEVSGGTYEVPAMTGARVAASTRAREAYFLEFAARVRQHVRVPTAVTGGFRSSAAMRAAVADGATDMVGLARALALMPELPRRTLAGEDVSVQLHPRSTGIKALDTLAMLQITWYETQLKRLGAGRPPRPNLSGWVAALSTWAAHGGAAFRRRR